MPASAAGISLVGGVKLAGTAARLTALEAVGASNEWNNEYSVNNTNIPSNE